MCKVVRAIRFGQIFSGVFRFGQIPHGAFGEKFFGQFEGHQNDEKAIKM